MVLLVAAACGGDDDGPSSSASTTTTATQTETAIEVFLLPADPGNDCTDVVAAPRVATDAGVLRSALTQLLAGPTEAETEAGLRSWFSADTAGMLNSVAISQRVARIDFDNFASLMPNASSSCGSASLLAQLDATVLQFDTVDSALYSFEGSPAAFYEWLQLRVPGPAA